jgi:signal transduction histidine kinase
MNTEERLSQFTALVATAIANAENREELDASRARIVATADRTRRRIERDLHDGVQQRLVSLSLRLREVEMRVPPGLGDLDADLSALGDELNGAMDDLREIAQGIHPAVLAEGGLRPALRTLARRSAVPVRVDVRTDRRLPDQTEVAAYYVASEALTNAAKHAQASLVELRLECSENTLVLSIRDDGIGGADPNGGSGLIGLSDRVEALGGELSVVSPNGIGTSVQMQLPVA